MGISLLIALSGAILFLIPARWNPRMVMRIFTTSEASIEMGAAYLMVAALSYPCTAITNTYVVSEPGKRTGDHQLRGNSDEYYL